MRGKKVYKVLLPLLILVSFLSIGSQVAKSYYDAKKIYDEVKPSLTNEEMLSRKEKNEALILLYHNVAKLKILLPKIFPKTSSGLFKISAPEILVNNSGRDVTAASITPPIKAPDTFVFLSIKST